MVPERTDPNGTWTVANAVGVGRRPIEEPPAEREVAVGTCSDQSRLQTILEDLQSAVSSGLPAVAANKALGTKPAAPETSDGIEQAGSPAIAQVSLSREIQQGMGGACDGDIAIQGSKEILDEIDQAVVFLKERKPEITLDRLAQIESRYGGKLTKRAQFRICANRGHAKHQMLEYSAAAELLRRAAEIEPDHEDAEYLLALADCAEGLNEKAHEKAEELRRRASVPTKVWPLWVGTAGENISLDDIIAQVPENLRNDVDVATAIAQQALRREDFATAELYARQALGVAPSWHVAKSFLATSILKRIYARHSNRLSLEPGYQEELAEARRFLTDAIEALSQHGPSDDCSRLRCNLAGAYRLLGDDAKTEEQLRIAHNESPSNPDYAAELARHLECTDRLDEAIDVIRPWMSASHPVRLDVILAELLTFRNREGDSDEAIRTLLARQADVPQESSAIREKWAWGLVCVTLRHNGADQAKAALNATAKDLLTPIMARVLEAEICQKAGDQAGAHAIAVDAMSLMDEEADSASMAHLAMLLESAADYERCF